MKRLIVCLCLLLCLLPLLPAAAEGGFTPYEAWCSAEVALPAAQHESGDQLTNAISRDQVVQVIGEKDDMLEAVVYTLSGEKKTLWLWKNDFTRVKEGDWHRLVYVKNPKKEDRLHLRRSGQRGSLSMGRYYTGVMPVALGPSRRGYTKVRLEMREGYMMTSYLEPLAIGEEPESALPLLLIAPENGQAVGMKLYPWKEASNLGRYPFGETVKLLGQTGDWCHVEALDGFTGFMPASAFPGQLREE